MKVLNILIILILNLMLGCSVSGGGVIEEDLNKTISCVDTRDGEKFSFNTNTVTNTRVGYGAPHSIDVVTSKGKKMTLTSDMEVWLKCE